MAERSPTAVPTVLRTGASALFVTCSLVVSYALFDALTRQQPNTPAVLSFSEEDPNAGLDTDHDGHPDAVEGLADTDNDGIVDLLDVESDGDGVSDVVDTAPADPNAW